MTKKFYDIIPKEQRSIRNIPLDVTVAPDDEKEHYFDPYLHKKKKIDGVKFKKKHSHVQQTHADVPVFIRNSSEEETFEEWNGKRKFKYVWVIACVLLLVLVYSAITWLSSAEILVSPVKHHVVLKKAKIALKDIKNTLVEFDQTESLTVPSGGFMEANSKAKGSIVLYNAYSTSAIKLASGSSLLAPNTLIYKTVNAVSIPGYKMVGGKKVPGSVVVNVEAEKVGDSYNASFTDFSVPSFKGTDKYDKVYGRSKTNIDGGLSGKVAKISKEAISSSTAQVLQTLASSTEEQIKNKIKNIDPAFVYIPKLTYLSYSAPEQKPSDDGKQILITAKVHGIIILLNKDSLSEQLVKENSILDDSQIGSRVKFDVDTTNVTATMQVDVDVDSIRKNFVYLFFSGDTDIASAIDEKKISSAVSGLSKSQALKVLPDLIESKDFQIKTSPWWTDTLPVNKGKIRVISQ